MTMINGLQYQKFKYSFALKNKKTGRLRILKRYATSLLAGIEEIKFELNCNEKIDEIKTWDLNYR